MSRFESTEDYYEWVEEVARNNFERDGSPARFVAENCIVAPEEVGDSVVLLYSGEPYVEERVWPKDIIQWHNRIEYPYPFFLSTDLRKLAVDLLEEDLQKATIQLNLNF